MAFGASPMWYRQAFLTPKTLNLLVIHRPALTAGIVIRGAEPTSGTVFAYWRSQPRNAASGSSGVVEASSCR